MPTNRQLIRKLLSLPDRNDRLAKIQSSNPESYKEIDSYIRSHLGIVHEIAGWEHWLKYLGPHTFYGSFAPFHSDLWQWYWPATIKQQDGEALNLEDITYFAIWGRGLGKSSSAEWLAIAEGCLIGQGFVLYVCGTQDQADSHVEAIRDRLEAEETLHKSYPGMRKPSGAKGFVSEHKRYGWRQDFLMTANGWAIRPVGLDKAIRGWKRGDNRVSLIILDDIDDDDDSPEVILKKERRIAKKILPMGTARTKVVFAQNLIHSNSVLNRMHTRQNNMLAVRRGDDAVKSFQEIKTEFRQTETGPRHIITHYVPTWKDLDITEAQSFLDRSDLPAFLAEYQHDFSGEQNERVLPEYDDRVLRTNLITWSQYEAMYHQRRIPNDWPCDVGLDVGFTAGHLSAWSFLSKAPEGYPLAGSVFRYRGRTFTNTEIGDQSVEVTGALWPNENLQREWSSHEGKSERLTLNTKHGWHFWPCDSDKKAGVSQWRHLLKADHNQPHPFHHDEKGANGLWKIGRPAWFDIVDDDQFIQPKDDKGLKVHRDQAYKWKMRPVEETKSGMTVEQPMKADEDSCDSTRMCTAKFGPIDKPQTLQQKIAAAIPQGYHRQELAQRTDIDPTTKEMTGFMAELLAAKSIKKPPKLYDPHGQPLR